MLRKVDGRSDRGEIDSSRDRRRFAPVVVIPARKQERDAERAQSTELGVALLRVAQGLDELLDGHGLLVGVGVALGGQPTRVDEDVGVGSHPGDRAGQVAVEPVQLFGGRGIEKRSEEVV